MMWNPPDPQRYNPLVYRIVAQIPPGCVSTYGQIASMIPPPDGIDPHQHSRLGARWVGTAMRLTPPDQDIPWHRVMNSQGRISLPDGTPAAHEQRTRLEAEGVSFDKTGRVSLKRFGWQGPPDDWLHEQGLFHPRRLA